VSFHSRDSSGLRNGSGDTLGEYRWISMQFRNFTLRRLLFTIDLAQEFASGNVLLVRQASDD